MARPLISLLALACLIHSAPAQDVPLGYYRSPAIHGETIVFVAEGDLWKVSRGGGVAQRLTTHPAEEFDPAISPDGKSLAFTARYEGPKEVYSMPLAGGRPKRLTYAADTRARVVGHLPDGRVLVSTRRFSTLPNQQLIAIDGEGRTERLPLAEADEGSMDPETGMLFFTRLPFQGSHAKRYRGGYIQNLWSFDSRNKLEARHLSPDFDGISKEPMFWRGRIYHLSDRDGNMNIWSMAPDGGDLKRHTSHQEWDIISADLDQGHIVYRLGADLYHLDLQAERVEKISITLASDHDHTRPNWIENPFEDMTAVSLSKDGSRLALTSRGRAFTLPSAGGRVKQVPQAFAARYRAASFDAKGEGLLVFSDESEEAEIWHHDGDGKKTQLTKDGNVLRTSMLPSPDGKWIAHVDKNARLALLELTSQTNHIIQEGGERGISGLTWSPDSRWLAYVIRGDNQLSRVRCIGIEERLPRDLTSDRWASYSPTWSTDGKWLFFLSDRNLRSLTGSPWGPRQPEPFLDRKTRHYALALQPGLRPPFLPLDELHQEKSEDKKQAEKGQEEGDSKKPETPAVAVDFDRIRERIWALPTPAGNYNSLVATDKRLIWTSGPEIRGGGLKIQALPLTAEPEVETVADGLRLLQVSADRKKILAARGGMGSGNLYVFDANAKALAGKALDKAKVDLSDWSFAVQPLEEWQMMYADAWRMHRDYFYDPGMHGVNWPEMRLKYAALVGRVSDRRELEDLTAQLISELSALHASVRGGDLREGTDQVGVGFLGARLERDADRGGFVIAHIYASDPDEPQRRSPLNRLDVEVRLGDVITKVNGQDALTAYDPGELLRDQVGKQVRLDLRRGDEPYAVVTKAISAGAESDLRYHEWEYTRRLEVERRSENRLGYVHLRAMGRGDMEQWIRDYYPIFEREGLVLDVRHNRGGNIDPWILSRLLRKTWFYWTQRTGGPMGNMQYAFNGHIVLLCDAQTASDGEAFSEGFKRLGLGKAIGTRTWGGEIWLSRSNRMVDGGVASAGMMGVYGLEREWLIENHGVDPDIVVDNLPHETFMGRDRQLEAAIAHLQELLEREPVRTPPPPAFPDKSFGNNRAK